MSTRTLLRAAGVCAAVIAPSTAFAVGVSVGGFGIGGGAPSGVGANVAGMPAVTTPGGIIATKQGVSSAASWVATTINQALLKTGSVLSSGQQQQIAAESKLMTAQTKDLANLFKKRFKINRAAQKAAQFGAQSQPLGTCGGSALGSGVSVADATGRQLGAKLQLAEDQYNSSFNVPSQYVTRMNKQAGADLSANSVLPPDGSITSLKAARAFVNNVLNPKPPVNLPKKDQKTPQGQRYMASRKIYHARMSLERASVRQILLMNTPTAPLGQWATLAWQSMGHKGTPPGVVSGRISPIAVEKLQVSLREGNPNWYNHIATENQTGLLRELALMRALSLKIQMQRLQLAMHQSMISAEHNAETIDHVERKRLNSQRNAALQTGG